MRVHQFMKTLLTGLILTSVIASSNVLLGAEIPTDAMKNFSRGMSRSHVGMSHFDRNPLPPPMPEISDVSLDQHGDLHGTFVNSGGLPQAGILVVARQDKLDPRTARTDAKGDFQLAGLKGGNWNITVGSKTSWVRVWTADVAPPAAKSSLLLTRKVLANPTATVIRGQSPDGGLLAAFDTGTLFSVGAGVAGITLGVIGISEASEANDQADSASASAALANDEAAALRDQLNALSPTVSAQTSQLSIQSDQISTLSTTLNEIRATLN